MEGGQSDLTAAQDKYYHSMHPENNGDSSIETSTEKPSLVEKIVDSIHQDIIKVIHTVKETENS